MDKFINISFMTDAALDTIHTNPSKVSEYIRTNIFDSKWLADMISTKIFEERKNKILDFELKTAVNGKYSEVEFDNAITLYEHLKDLPRYVLTDERFWCWLEFEKCYRAAIQAMPLRTDTTFDGTWIFTRGKRRSIWFNVLARSYFWVEFTIDEELKDKYELTKFVFEKHERIRHLTFDNKYRQVIINAIKAEKKLYDKYANDSEYADTFKKCEVGNGTTNIYTYIRKKISLYGSVKMLDLMDNDLFDVIYNKLEEALMEIHKGNIDILTK